MHRLPSPRCPWSESSVSAQAPCTAFPCRSISPYNCRPCAPRPMPMPKRCGLRARIWRICLPSGPRRTMSCRMECGAHICRPAGGHIKMHGPWGLLLDERSIMKLFMLATFFDKTPCRVSMPVAFPLGRRTAMKSVTRGLVGQCRRARRPRAGAHCWRIVAAAHDRQNCAWQRRLRGLPSIQI